MKLRNKKTEEIVEPICVEWVACDEITFAYTTADDCEKALCYHSFAEFNEEWEDYTPVEPLIKDEKIRKAVKAWAEANEETEIKVKGGCLVATFKGLHKQLELELNCTWTRDGVYSIAELCGEEE